jgi:hypothetical protein
MTPPHFILPIQCLLSPQDWYNTLIIAGIDDVMGPQTLSRDLNTTCWSRGLAKSCEHKNFKLDKSIQNKHKPCLE